MINATLKFTPLFANLEPQMMSLLDASDVEKDIRTVFEFRFRRIKDQHAGWALCLTDGPIPEDLNNWPTQDAVDTLVRESAGLFIYADAAMNYIEDPHSHPVERLWDILSKDDFSFEMLDQVYARILLQIPVRFSEDIQAILNWMIFGEEKPKSKTLCDSQFGFDAQYSTILLSHLASVIHVPSSGHNILETKSLQILHASFPNFLQDRLRLQRYRVENFHCNAVVTRSKLEELPTSERRD